MIRWILFKLIDIWLIFRRRNWEVIEQGDYSDGTMFTRYTYNGNEYTHIGDFPFKPSIGFRIPIQSVLVDGRDETSLVKQYMGPFRVSLPDTGYIFYKKQLRFEFGFVNGGIRFRLVTKRVKGDRKDVQITRLSVLDRIQYFQGLR